MLVQRNLRNYAIQHRLLSSGDRVLVAVSGGPDSVALLHMLYELRVEFQLYLEVAHLQHGIRGEEAREDARFVADLAEKLKLPFHLKELDLPRMKSDAGKGNLEALARAERYRFFAETVRARNLNKVATAHTQDDQAETMLMWFLRGAGMRGLGGMSPQQQLQIAAGELKATLTVIRPLLDVAKCEVLEYLKDRNFTYRVDRSNQDSMFLRNWIRSELMPKIRERVGGGFSGRLSQQGQLLRDEDAYLDELTRKACHVVADGVGLNRIALLKQPKALQRRILRHWIEQARGHLRGLDFAHIEALLRLIGEGPAQGRLPIPGGWEVVREYENLRLEKSSRRFKRFCYSYSFEIGTAMRIAEGRMEFTSRRVPSSQARLPANLTEAIFDASCLTAPLWVRNFRHGDRFQPLGMAGHKKIKDLFIENRVPLSIRAKLPLLIMGEEILWIPGYGRSETGRVSEKTVTAVHIKATPIQT